jgi:GAF domain-containing protein
MSGIEPVVPREEATGAGHRDGDAGLDGRVDETEGDQIWARVVREQLRRMQVLLDESLTRLPLDELLVEILDRVRELLQSDSATLFLLDPARDVLVLRATIGLERDPDDENEIPVGKGFAGSIAASGQPVVVPDTALVHPVSRFLRVKVHSVVGVPLVVEDRVVGVIHAGSRTTGRFGPDDVEVLQVAAARLAPSIENAQLHAAEREARELAERETDRLRRLQLVTETLSSTGSLEDVTDLILRQALDATGAASGVVVLADDRAEELRLVAAEGYDAGVTERWTRFPLDGSTPLGAAILGGEPVVVSNPQERDRRFPGLADTSDRRYVAWAALPMESGAKVLGGLGLSFKGERTFEPAELAFMANLARQCAIAIERARLFDAERESTVRASFLSEASDILATSLEYEHTLAQVAQLAVPRLADWCSVEVVEGPDREIRALVVAHADPEKVELARRLREDYPPDPDATTGVPNVIRTGTSEFYPEITDEMIDAAAADKPELRDLIKELQLRSVITVPLAARGATFGAMTFVWAESGRTYTEADMQLAESLAERAGVAIDNARLFEAERRAHRRAEAASSRIRLLADIGGSLATSLEPTQVAARLVEHLAGGLADHAVVYLVRPDGRLEHTASARSDSAAEPATPTAATYVPDMEDPNSIVASAIRTGQPELTASITQADIDALPADDDQRRSFRAQGVHSSMVLPLLTPRESIGALVLVRSADPRPFDDADLSFAEDVARRASQALENARLYAERAFVARTLERSLLPPRLPEIDGLELAVRYRPAGRGLEVGGDFYDVFSTGEDDWALVIGDVCGKGAKAAAVMALSRYTVRTAALEQRRPSDVLAILNEALLRQEETDRFCTACYVRVHPSPLGLRATSAVGGHPLPLVLRADGSLETLGNPGTLLGTFADPTLTDAWTDLQPGDAIVLYTDGVTDERRHDEEFGEERLADVLISCAGLSAEAVAGRIVEAVISFREEDPMDDIAVLVMRVAP